MRILSTMPFLLQSKRIFLFVLLYAIYNREYHFSFSSGSETVVKVGEGTYGEAFKVGNCVCKIVPFDGDLRVNGEIQKVTVAFISQCFCLQEQFFK